MNYSIVEFSRITGLGIHTLRFYEQEYLIIPEHNSSNHRCYSDKDMAWIDFYDGEIARLSISSFRIKQMPLPNPAVWIWRAPRSKA